VSEIKSNFHDLEKHVCSLKWSIRLFELGARQDTYFHWIYIQKDDRWEVLQSDDDFYEDDVPHFAAYTAQDFVDLFPRVFTLRRINIRWRLECDVISAEMDIEEKLADVFARILITLIKNKNEQKKLN